MVINGNSDEIAKITIRDNHIYRAFYHLSLLNKLFKKDKNLEKDKFN